MLTNNTDKSISSREDDREAAIDQNGAFIQKRKVLL